MRALARTSDAILDAMARRADDFMWINARSLPLFEISAKVVIVGGAIYAIMVIWQKDLTGLRSWDEFPAEARDYLEVLAAETGVGISRVSVGPGRDQVVPAGA